MSRFKPIVHLGLLLVLIPGLFIPGCGNARENAAPVPKEPLVTHLFTADPSAHVFEDKLYIYPSHDIYTTVRPDMWGSQYDMKDYHVFSIVDFSTPVTDHGEVLNVRDVPGAKEQMWAPDAAFKNGRYYLYFPAHDKGGIFRIGVASSDRPSGPFTPQPEPIAGSFSIDPAVFVDDDGRAYMYFGGLMGGQLERWRTGTYREDSGEPEDRALGPRMARLSEDMLSFDGPVREVVILDEDGRPVQAEQSEKCFFEASWMHKYRGAYYLSYSTGYTHLLVYATADNPLGPFTYRGCILTPVSGWTTHHSIVEFKGKWYLFYHDDSLSGRDNQRCIKYQELHYTETGDIVTLDP
jgi:beta-xylosidase